MVSFVMQITRALRKREIEKLLRRPILKSPIVAGVGDGVCRIIEGGAESL